MNKEKIKLIVHNMDLLVQSLKEEIQDFPDISYEDIVPYIEDDVDEYYVEEEDV